jgi:hypothetical protein
VIGLGPVPLGQMTGPDLAARRPGMCLTCGCMQAHLEMGMTNIRYEDVKAAADENGRSVAETLEIMDRTVAKDREDHAEEYQPA